MPQRLRLAVLAAVLAAALVLTALPAAARRDEPILLFSYECLAPARDAVDTAAAGFAEKAAFSRQVQAELVPQVIAALGVPAETVETEVTPGGYLLETNASLQSRLPIARDRADAFAAALGYVCRQDAVLVSDFGTEAGDTGYAIVSFPDDALTAAVAQAFFEHAAAIDEGLGGGYTAFRDEMIFLNVRDEDGVPYSGLDNGTFMALMAQAAATFPDHDLTILSSGVARAWFVGNDWDAAPQGGDYIGLLGGPDSDLVETLTAVQRQRDAMLARAAETHGWETERQGDRQAAE
jgi:hypothetical protein